MVDGGKGSTAKTETFLTIPSAGHIAQQRGREGGEFCSACFGTKLFLRSVINYHPDLRNLFLRRIGFLTGTITGAGLPRYPYGY